MIHAGQATDDAALCGDADGKRTIFSSKVSCPACIARRERAYEIARYRCDGELCRQVLITHAVRRGNEWRDKTTREDRE